MENLKFSIVMVFVVYLLYVFIVIMNKKRLEKYKKSTEVQYLTFRFKIKIEDYDIKKIAHLLCFSNACILSTIFFMSTFVENIMLKFLVIFALVFALIIIVYGVIGNELKKGLFKKRGN